MYQPLFTRILKEDLGKATPEWVDKLIYQLNTITDFLKIAFARGISIQDNLVEPFKVIQFKATGSPATDTLSFQVALPFGYQPRGVIVVNAIDLSGSIVGNAVWAEMTPGIQPGNVVSIRAIYGLTLDHTYQFTFLVL